MSFKGLIPNICAIIATCIVVIALGGFLYDDCDDFIEVIVDRHDLNGFILTEVCGGEILLTSILYSIFTFLRLSDGHWLFFVSLENKYF